MSTPGAAHHRITTQILFVVLLPVIVITVILTAYYASARHADLKTFEREQGEAVTNYLAQAAELGIYAGDERALKGLARSTMKRPLVNGVAFLDNQGEPLVQKGNVQLQAAATVQLTDRFTIAASAGNLVFSRPIVTTPMPMEDFGAAEVAGQAVQPELIGWVILSQSRDKTIGRIDQMLLTAGLLALVAIMIGVIAALRAGATIGKPVRELTGHLRAIDQPGAQLEFEPRGSEETVFLAQGINALTERIQRQLMRQREKIDEATATLSNRNQQLEETRQGLEEALQAKDDFLARVSHELRTPLTTIIGFNRLIGTTVDADQVREYSHHIEQASSLLHSIIDDILDYSRLQSSQFELESIPFNLEECLENVVGMHGYEAVAKHLELVLLLDGDIPRHGIGDPQRLQQVVNNLVANALKFTSSGEVIIRVTLLQRHPDSATLQCEIRDTGIGIPLEDQARMFQPFTQADNSITRVYGGSGLGLAISRSLVEMMHGEIALTSEPGLGTRVTFSFDIGLDPDAADIGTPSRRTTVPVLAYDANDWSRRALRSALLQWSVSISVCADREQFMAQLAKLDDTAMVVLSLSHSEAQATAFPAFAHAIRRTFAGTIAVLSPMPDMAAQAATNGVSTKHMGFVLKPLRRGRLVECCYKLLNPGVPGPALETTSQSLSGLAILVAEDHTLIRELLARNLRSAGARVETVADGEQAVLACLGARFDLLLMDLHMPRMDGASAARNIRAQGKTMPILGLTADITAQERESLNHSGVDAILLKPVNEAELVRLVRHHCGLVESEAPNSPLTAGPEPSDSRLRESLLELLELGRAAYTAGQQERYQQVLHDILGVAGMYEKRLLEELVREMKRQALELNAAETEHLFAEAETLIRKY